VKTAISIPDSLFDAADRLAKRLGVSRSEFYQRAVLSYIEKHKAEGVTESLDALYESGGVSSGLDTVIEHLQGASIAKEDW
jgi:metal-responsive CopG/Arc/MetJ family transcriptional regulator